MGSATLLPMRFFVYALCLFLSAAAQPAHAGAQKAGAASLDDLFIQLKRSANESAANRIARSITGRLEESGSATIDLLMLKASEAMAEGENDVALDLLDQVIMLDPAFAEGWNRRATLHFKMRNFNKSVADIHAVLEREPRHFGALAGLAAIFMATGREESALAVYERVLVIYPMMRDAQRAVGTLADKLAGEGI